MRQRVASSVVVVICSAFLISLGFVSFPGVSQASEAAHSRVPYYLSLGDSYSIGYQPTSSNPGGGTPGYTAYVAEKENMTLENFGCGGATTSSLDNSVGCGDPAYVNAAPYPDTTQEQAALNFIAAHPGKVGLITVSIGGNDFDGCSTASCVEAAMPTMEANIKSLVSSLSAALDAASDPSTAIVGLTYPDVDLGLYVYPTDPPSSSDLSLAQLSVTAFDDLINPTLSESFLSVPQGRFVNVTSAPYKNSKKGDDTKLTKVENFPPYGTIPVAVAEICTLTYFCSQGNIHANTKGYKFIGKLIVASHQTS
jgi:lysophospholipase L1-like esterase